jgi:hypothetical protein
MASLLLSQNVSTFYATPMQSHPVSSSKHSVPCPPSFQKWQTHIAVGAQLSRRASRRSFVCCAEAAESSAELKGENMDWEDSEHIVLGLAHCFVKDDSGKLQDMFVIEPIPAGALECMENGGVTCYKHATATTLGVALKQDSSLLPPEFAEGKFADEFDFRAKCAARTWQRDHPQKHLMNLVPQGGVRSDWNFSLEDKRILNMIYEVSDADNIKQDISIDVYGRAEKEAEKEVEKLYNV